MLLHVVPLSFIHTRLRCIALKVWHAFCIHITSSTHYIQAICQTGSNGRLLSNSMLKISYRNIFINANVFPIAVASTNFDSLCIANQHYVTQGITSFVFSSRFSIHWGLLPIVVGGDSLWRHPVTSSYILLQLLSITLAEYQLRARCHWLSRY